MSREEILARHSLVEFVRGRGHELRSAGKNFVTNACPVTAHKLYHRCVTIDVGKQVWFCNDCKVGGTVIDWLMRERGINASQAMKELGGGNNDSGSHGKIVKAYDYIGADGKLKYQICRKVFQPLT